MFSGDEVDRAELVIAPKDIPGVTFVGLPDNR
jgi:hypothetical protein